MSVDEATVRRIAKLARIAVSDEEAASLQGDLSTILDWVEQLNEVDVENVEPLTSVVETTMRMREDVVSDGGYPDNVVSNAPAKDEHFFMVPKVVE
ncbi:MAG: Asp-tRNA(Asn)/Glu-tRNA(Gln) amidotransferase subunit GatC [Hyphomicrobiales bacterium]